MESKEGKIRIKCDKLVLGLDMDKDMDKVIDKRKDRSNLSIENPVIDIPTNKKFRENRISVLLVIANITEKRI